VNCFLAEGEDGYTVIDTGLHNETSVNTWEKELAGKNVKDLIITHYHPDHFGYAGGFQEKYGSRVSMSKTDAENGLSAWEKSFLGNLQRNYELSGIPEKDAAEMAENTKSFVPLVTPYPKVDHYLEEGEKLKIGKLEYEVIFTPGHSEGLVTFYNQEENILIGTDHILPRITPNISHWFHGDPNPLQSFYHSLDKIAKLEVDLVIPSHGKPFRNGHQRVIELKEHHDERLETLLEILKTPKTIFQASEALFNKVLTVHEMRFAIGETLAHLEYLRLDKKCSRELQHGLYIYQAE
jgi:glyoxylase-like metal-dependent hydrolase (beta-lactamase superfamily II)